MHTSLWTHVSFVSPWVWVGFRFTAPPVLHPQFTPFLSLLSHCNASSIKVYLPAVTCCSLLCLFRMWVFTMQSLQLRENMAAMTTAMPHPVLKRKEVELLAQRE